jgi:hypothetical protein
MLRPEIFNEKLREEHGIKLSYSWVKLALQGAGFGEEGVEAWDPSQATFAATAGAAPGGDRHGGGGQSLPARALHSGSKNRNEFPTLSSALGNPAKNKDAGFPHSHSDGKGLNLERRRKNKPDRSLATKS